MKARPLLRTRLRAGDALPSRRAARYERTRVALPDGAATTLHVASYDRAAFGARLVCFDRPMPLVRWCAANGVRHAVVGGFFTRPGYEPLGEVRIAGGTSDFVPFDPPWGAMRACVHLAGGAVAIARRPELPDEPTGDVLQAGPLLVAAGASVVADGADPEGFSAGAGQFDSNITDGRYPRAAFGVAADRVLAVACDGRNRRDAGMTLGELADTMVGLGAEHALNLDGGGSASLVHSGRLRNRPREQHGIDLLEGRPVITALVFENL